MSNILKIKDINNNTYIVENVDEFISHIDKFHSKGSSIHEENGYFFKVDDSFRKLIIHTKKRK